MLTRYSDWPSRLQSYLNSRRDARFQYGELDCCLFSCDCIQAITGTDLAAWFRGKYKSRKEALSLIKQRTGDSGVAAIANYAANEHGLESIPVSMARRGDMVLVGTGSKALLGVMALNGADIMCLGKQGIMRVALSHATRAWRV